MNRKVKSFKQTLFLLEQFAVLKRYNKCSKCILWALTQIDDHFAPRLLPCQ